MSDKQKHSAEEYARSGVIADHRLITAVGVHHVNLVDAIPLADKRNLATTAIASVKATGIVILLDFIFFLLFVELTSFRSSHARPKCFRCRGP